MNNQKFQFQDPGEGIHEAEVLEVLVSEGDEVSEGQDVLVVETDKAAFELAAPRDGEIASVEVSTGDVVHVGDTLMTFRDGGDANEQAAPAEREADASREGEGKADAKRGGAKVERGHRSQQDQPGERPVRQREAQAEPEREAKPKSQHGTEGKGRRAKGQEQPENEALDMADEPRSRKTPDEGLAERAGKGRPPVPATPATRRLARELDVDLTEVRPSESDGRVRDEDVRAFAEGVQQHEESTTKPEHPEGRRHAAGSELPDFAQQGPIEKHPLRSIRRKTAERMTRAWAEIPHVTHHDMLDITQLERWRRQLAPRVEDAGGKLSLSVLLVKAICANLQEFERFNASLDTDNGELIIKHYYNIGVAVDTERGLLVPVVKNAAAQSLMKLSSELPELAARARSGKARHQELTGSSFTLTNVGPLGGTGFTPMINYPEVAILGVGRARLRTVVTGDLDSHEIATRLMLPVSLAFDHRVIDGAEAARFVTALGRRLGDVEGFMLSI